MLSTDFMDTVKLLKKLGIEYTRFEDPRYIHEDAVKAGCKVSICIRDVTDIHFDKNGRCIGSSTDSIGSFKPRPKRKTK